MNYLVQYETMTDTVSLIRTHSAYITLSSEDDIPAQLARELVKVDANAQLMSYEHDDDNDDIDHLIEYDPYFC